MKDFLDNIPLPLLGLANGIAGLLLLGDLLLLDPLPLIEEAVLIGLFYVNSREMLRRVRRQRLEGDLPTPSRDLEGAIKRVQVIRDQLKTVRGELRRIGGLGSWSANFGRIRSISKQLSAVEKRLVGLKGALDSGEFDRDAVERQVRDLRRRLGTGAPSAADDSVLDSLDVEPPAPTTARGELELALSYARNRLVEIDRLEKERELAVARVERCYQLLANLRTQILSRELRDETPLAAVNARLDDLAETVEAFGEAEAELDRLLARDRLEGGPDSDPPSGRPQADSPLDGTRQSDSPPDDRSLPVPEPADDDAEPRDTRPRESESRETAN